MRELRHPLRLTGLLSGHACMQGWLAGVLITVLLCCSAVHAHSGNGEYEKILTAIQRDLEDPLRNCALLLEGKAVAPLQSEVEKLDLKEFSIRTTLYGQDRANDLDPGCLEAGVQALCAERIYNTALRFGALWPISLLPFEDYRRMAFDRLPERLGNVTSGSVRHGSLEAFQGVQKMDDAERLLGSPFRTDASEFDETALREHIAREKSRQTDLKPPHAVLLALCGSQGRLLDASSCARALGTMIDSMTPTGTSITDMVLHDEFFELFRSERSVEPLRKLSLRILEQVKSRTLPQGNLFDDLRSSFLESGMSVSEAYEATWLFLGVSATAGTNVSFRLASLPHQNTVRQFYPLLFGVINMGSSVLDARSLRKTGRFYSYPRNVATVIENSKPYHFWMSAYLARRAVLQIGNPDAAANAAWLAQLGYQVKSTTAGREPGRAFTKAPFGPENNKIRLDLAYAANGAVFGAEAASVLPQRTFDINATLRNLLTHGEALTPIPNLAAQELFEGTGLSAWKRWRRIFSPDSAIATARETR